MWAGVGKSGSPAPKPITGSPAAFSALALASTARVADSAMAATRAEMRCSDMVLSRGFGVGWPFDASGPPGGRRRRFGGGSAAMQVAPGEQHDGQHRQRQGDG